VIPSHALSRDAYRDAFGEEPGSVTIGLAVDDFRVSVIAPNERPIMGCGPSPTAALENLIDLLKSLKPGASG
jgi:hypothetical protein